MTPGPVRWKLWMLDLSATTIADLPRLRRLLRHRDREAGPDGALVDRRCGEGRKRGSERRDQRSCKDDPLHSSPRLWIGATKLLQGSRRCRAVGGVTARRRGPRRPTGTARRSRAPDRPRPPGRGGGLLAADRGVHPLELEPVGVRRSTSIRSTPSVRRSSITGSLQCHGSSRKSEPSVPIASSSSRFGSEVPQSNNATDVAREPQHPGEHPVGPARADVRRAGDALGLAREQARAADAVAADVHQRAALDVGAQADVAPRRTASS